MYRNNYHVRQILITAGTAFRSSGSDGAGQDCLQDPARQADIIVERWNAAVDDDDIVYHLGNVTSGLTDEELRGILSGLHGHKRLVMGGNDNVHDDEFWRSVGFEKVYDVPIIIEDFVILSYDPIYVSDRMPYINVFGREKKGEGLCSKNWYCAACRLNDYAPVSTQCIADRILEKCSA